MGHYSEVLTHMTSCDGVAKIVTGSIYMSVHCNWFIILKITSLQALLKMCINSRICTQFVYTMEY